MPQRSAMLIKAHSVVLYQNESKKGPNFYLLIIIPWWCVSIITSPPPSCFVFLYKSSIYPFHKRKNNKQAYLLSKHFLFKSFHIFQIPTFADKFKNKLARNEILELHLIFCPQTQKRWQAWHQKVCP